MQAVPSDYLLTSWAGCSVWLFINIVCRLFRLIIYSFRAQAVTSDYLLTSCAGCCSERQSFRVRPQDLSAVVGTDVLLPCEVDNQQGPAQWAKDGFAYGECVVPVTNHVGRRRLCLRWVCGPWQGHLQCSLGSALVCPNFRPILWMIHWKNVYLRFRNTEKISKLVNKFDSLMGRIALHT